MTTREETRTETLGLLVVRYFHNESDARGPFEIPFNEGSAEVQGYVPDGGRIEQVLVSRSVLAGTPRGFHRSMAGKLVSSPFSRFVNVAVDLRDPSSETFGMCEMFELSPGTAVYVPRGYGNGLANTHDAAVYLYTTDGRTRMELELTIDLRDPDIGVVWPGFVDFSLRSAKDGGGHTLGQCRQILRERPELVVAVS